MYALSWLTSSSVPSTTLPAAGVGVDHFGALPGYHDRLGAAVGGADEVPPLLEAQP